jgi:AraC-like DNA-binding protein
MKLSIHERYAKLAVKRNEQRARRLAKIAATKKEIAILERIEKMKLKHPAPVRRDPNSWLRGRLAFEEHSKRNAEIVAMFEDDWTLEELAEYYKMSPTRVQRIVQKFYRQMDTYSWILAMG